MVIICSALRIPGCALGSSELSYRQVAARDYRAPEGIDRHSVNFNACFNGYGNACHFLDSPVSIWICYSESCNSCHSSIEIDHLLFDLLLFGRHTSSSRYSHGWTKLLSGSFLHAQSQATRNDPKDQCDFAKNASHTNVAVLIVGTIIRRQGNLQQ